jgi:anti-anti-sigma factor
VPDKAARRVDRLRRGDHACLVCETDDERWSTVSRFVERGLERGERTLYVASDHDEEHVLARLGPRAPAAGELLVAPAEAAYGYADGNSFDHVTRVSAWEAQVQDALDDGFSGLRVVADMAWLHEVELALADLVDYEHRCTALCNKAPAVALCVYDKRRFDDHTLARAVYSHETCLGREAGARAIFESAMMRISTTGPGVLRLSGEVDVSNAAVLAGALKSASNGQEALLVDVSRLEFIDVAGVRTIHSASEALIGRGGEMVLLSPRPAVRKTIALLGADGFVTVEEAAP